jgi:hypothetical protein
LSDEVTGHDEGGEMVRAVGGVAGGGCFCVVCRCVGALRRRGWKQEKEEEEQGRGEAKEEQVEQEEGEKEKDEEQCEEEQDAETVVVQEKNAEEEEEEHLDGAFQCKKRCF